ncbi:hypothetical protein HYS47_00265, partial [Candidatus Woesearchaeota archaeon]|nr:hypothetical protein [Candidatus Woesearchaeota archaeon]
MNQLTFKQKILVYDVIIYTCLALLLLWIILKFVGVIQTPLWLELLPYFLAGVSLFGAVMKVGSFFGRLDRDIHY